MNFLYRLFCCCGNSNNLSEKSISSPNQADWENIQTKLTHFIVEYRDSICKFLYNQNREKTEEKTEEKNICIQSNEQLLELFINEYPVYGENNVNVEKLIKEIIQSIKNEFKTDSDFLEAFSNNDISSLEKNGTSLHNFYSPLLNMPDKSGNEKLILEPSHFSLSSDSIISGESFGSSSMSFSKDS